MSVQYLLPCGQCQESLPVEPRQAGSQVRCSCGAPLEVPTLRGLRALEMVEKSEPLPARGAWGARQGMMLLGLLLLVGSAIPAGYCLTMRPEKPRYDVDDLVRHYHHHIDQMPLYQTWGVWKLEMLGQGLDDRPSDEEFFYELRIKNLNRWGAVAGIGMILGLALFLAGWVSRQDR